MIAAATTIAILSPASAGQRSAAKAPACTTAATPLMLGVGY
jgi:hypothetical protein